MWTLFGLLIGGMRVFHRLRVSWQTGTPMVIGSVVRYQREQEGRVAKSPGVWGFWCGGGRAGYQINAMA